jgi:hypothetical protein
MERQRPYFCSDVHRGPREPSRRELRQILLLAASAPTTDDGGVHPAHHASDQLPAEACSIRMSAHLGRT